MRRRAFIQTASVGALGLLSQAGRGQQTPKSKVEPKAATAPKAPVALARIQQLADGGS